MIARILNRVRGTVAIEESLGDCRWQLHLTMGAMQAAEALYGAPFGEMMRQLAEPARRVQLVFALLLPMLQAVRPEATAAEAEELIRRMGLEEAARAVVMAITVALPEAEGESVHPAGGEVTSFDWPELLVTFLASGFTAKQFFAAAPKLVRLYFKAAEMRQLRERNLEAWLAWHVAVLSRAKKVPELKELLMDPERSRRPGVTDWKRQLEVALKWHALGRGKVEFGAAKAKGDGPEAG